MSEGSVRSKRASSTGKEENVTVDPPVLHSEEHSEAFERRTIRHVDRRLLPLLALLYSVALVDRTNLSITRVAGMERDLKLNLGDRYSIVSLIFFIPYVLLQLPSNILLRALNPVVALSGYVIAWGAVQTGMAFVPTWGYLGLCRVLLGAMEAGFFPGMVFIITTWYKRHEVQKRLSTFYLISIVITGFSNILGYGFSTLNGKGGLAGWRWIFLIEGLITIVLGIIAFFYVPAFPDQNTFLSKEATALVLDRVERDRGDALPDKITKEKVLLHLKDWTIWAHALMFMAATMPSYMVAYFITVILSSMHWGQRDSMLLSAPPAIAAAFSVFGFAYWSDRMKKRALFLAPQCLITLIGLVVAGYAKQPGARYFGLFFVQAGASGCVPGIIGYNANNIVSHSKRSVATALIVSFGGIGGIMATTTFRQHDYPRYINGFWATIGCQLLMLSLMGVLTITYSRRNKLVDEGKLVAEGQPGFKYTL